MRASRIRRVISRLRKVLERSIKAQVEGLDVNFYILNKCFYKIDVELSYIVLKLRGKMKFCQLKQNVIEELYLDFRS